MDVNKLDAQYDDFISATNKKDLNKAKDELLMKETDLYQKQLKELKNAINNVDVTSANSKEEYTNKIEAVMKDNIEAKDSKTLEDSVQEVVDTNEDGTTQTYIRIDDGDETLLIQKDQLDAQQIIDELMIDTMEDDVQEAIAEKIEEHNTDEDTTEEQKVSEEVADIDLSVKLKAVQWETTTDKVIKNVKWFGYALSQLGQWNFGPLKDLVKHRAGLFVWLSTAASTRGKDKIAKAKAKIEWSKLKQKANDFINEIFDPLEEIAEPLAEVSDAVEDVTDVVS